LVLIIATNNLDLLAVVNNLNEKVVNHIDKVFLPMKKVLVPEEIRKNGSQVSSNEYNDILKFASFPLDMEAEVGLLSWNLSQLNDFKRQAKDIILSKMERIISIANNKKAMEVNSVTPLLRNLMEELLVIAFPNEDIKSVFSIKGMNYSDAKIRNSYDNKIYSYKGKMDLALIYTRLNICIGGFENKVSKTSLVLENDLNTLNKLGTRAVAQTGTQILGAVQKFKILNLDESVFTMMMTNAWQWVLVRRQPIIGGDYAFKHFNPISLATKDDSRAEVVAKPPEDVSYDQVSHVLGLMFDNVDYILQRAKRVTMTSSIQRQTIYEEESNDSKENSKSDDDFEKRTDQDENKFSKSHSTRNESNQIFKSSKNNDNSKKITTRQGSKRSLREIDRNIVKYGTLTSANLKCHNLGY